MSQIFQVTRCIYQALCTCIKYTEFATFTLLKLWLIFGISAGSMPFTSVFLFELKLNLFTDFVSHRNHLKGTLLQNFHGKNTPTAACFAYSYGVCRGKIQAYQSEQKTRRLNQHSRLLLKHIFSRLKLNIEILESTDLKNHVLI